ncbi:MAG: site-specific integrase [Erythrobacter sp.]|nr:MAG: site-specific integrase [Erythrobacter sp.]
MATALISKRTVDDAKPGPRDQFVWDTATAGFGLKVTPAGRKTYVFQYRIARPGEADRTHPIRYTIGRHGSLTPEQARRRAKELAALVDCGICPRERDRDAFAAADEAQREAFDNARLEGELAFERIADLWLDHYEHEKERRPSSVRLAKLVVNGHLKPVLTGKPMPHIDREEIQPIIDAIPARQRAMRRAVFAYASVLFGWAHKRGDIAANPLSGMVKPDAPKARDRVLSDFELAAVWQGASDLANPFGAFFRLLILTGQRRSEVAGIGWAELDRSTATWTIPAARAKNGVAHIVPLAPAAVAELDRLSRAEHGETDEPAEKWPKTGLVLTTTGITPISGITKAKAALDDRIAKDCEEPIPGWRIHDLRRTLATGFQRLGVRYEVTEAVLNHVSGAKGGVAGIYQRHTWKDEKRTALDAWAHHVTSLATPIDANKVVSISEAKKSA